MLYHTRPQRECIALSFCLPVEFDLSIRVDGDVVEDVAELGVDLLGGGVEDVVGYLGDGLGELGEGGALGVGLAAGVCDGVDLFGKGGKLEVEGGDAFSIGEGVEGAEFEGADEVFFALVQSIECAL